MDRLLTDVHGDDVAELNESPHNRISRGLAHYLQEHDDVRRTLSRLAPEVVNKYSLMAVMEAARLAGIKVIAVDCAASYFLKGGDGHADDWEAWRIPVMNYFSYLVLSQTEDERDPVSQGSPNGKWIALVGDGHISEFDGVPGLSELMGVPGIRFEDARENCLDVDAGFEVNHSACFLEDDKNIRVKADFVFKVAVQQGDRQQGDGQHGDVQRGDVESDAQRADPRHLVPQPVSAQRVGAEQKAIQARPSFLSRAWDYLSCFPGSHRV